MTGWTTKPPAGVQIDWTNPITSGLVLCHLYNEGAGLRANDLSGNGNHGVLTGFEPFSATSGWIGHGLTFDGTNDYVDAGNSTSLNIVHAITVEVWINKQVGSGSQNIVSKFDGTSNNRAWTITDTTFTVEEIKTVHNAATAANSSINIIDGVYHQVVGTWSTGAKPMIYIDGNLQGTAGLAVTDMDIVSTNVYIGKLQATYFNGTIDEVRIWNRALSAKEVQQLYAQPYAMFKSQTANILKMIA